MSSSRVRALPAVWRGRRFRSRTEARWAVFFDHLKVGCQYEPEGIALPDGRRYLPDFLVAGSIVLEVKPPLAECDERDASSRDRLQALVAARPPFKGVILHGTPADYRGFQVVWPEALADGSAAGSPAWAPVRWRECRRCEGIWLVHTDDEFGSAVSCAAGCTSYKYNGFEHLAHRIRAAIDASQTVTFEQG
jgi:hypothetical protein